MTFGEYVKKMRIERRVTLREFCRVNNLDPSNWSTVERGMLSPPKSRTVLEMIAGSLGLLKNSEEWNSLFDLAAVAHIPKEIISDENLLDKLPVFFRTVRGEKPTAKELEELIDLIKESRNVT